MLIIFSRQKKLESKFLQGKINFIFDGDSFRLSNGYQIRLLGIDSPEKSQQLSETAKYFLFQLIPIHSEISYEIIKIDKYNRIIANVYNSDGFLVNAEMVKHGLAYVYYRYLSDCSPKIQERLLQAEKYARINYLGVWSLDNPILPETFRYEMATTGELPLL